MRSLSRHIVRSRCPTLDRFSSSWLSCAHFLGGHGVAHLLEGHAWRTMCEVGAAGTRKDGAEAPSRRGSSGGARATTPEQWCSEASYKRVCPQRVAADPPDALNRGPSEASDTTIRDPVARQCAMNVCAQPVTLHRFASPVATDVVARHLRRTPSADQASQSPAPRLTAPCAGEQATAIVSRDDDAHCQRASLVRQCSP